MSTLYVGLDLSLKNVAVAFKLDDTTEPVKRFSFPHNPLGVDLLIERINGVVSKLKIDKIEIGMEATGNLWTALVETLRSHPGLAGLDANVHNLNARQVAKFKKIYPDIPKTDPLDALMIAEFLRFRKPPKPLLIDEKYLALQKLTRHRFQLAQSVTSEKNRFLTNLFLKFSAFRQEKPFSDPFGATSSALLMEFLTVDEIAEASIEDLAAFLIEKSKNSFADPEQVANAVRNAARNSYRLNKCLSNPVNLVLAMTLENIRFFERQIDAVDKAIAKELAAFNSYATILLSVPGLGPVFTAGIIAEIQDVRRFDSDSALAKFASIVWKKNQSGEFDSDDTPMSRAGNKYLRYYLVEAANSLRTHNDEFARFYKTKYRESTTHHHKRACVLCARKLVRLIFNLLHKGVLYKTPDQRKEDRAENPSPKDMTQGELVRHITRRRQAKRAFRVHRD
ncbi:MAG: IS110 family transposase [Armatimonadota bacterium]